MRSIRWKLILTSFVVVFLPIYLLNHYTITTFDGFTSKALEEDMINQAVMLGEQYRSMVLQADPGNEQDMERRFASAVRRYGERIQSRLQVLSPRGIVLFDSDPDSLVGSDFSSRKEIISAMRGTYDAEWRLSKQLNRVYYYVPLPIREGDQVVGIAYISHHTGQITKAIKRMLRDHKVSMFTAIAAAILVSALLAQTMTHRLRKLTKAARDYSRGDAPLALAISGRDEIGELGNAVRHMADDIEKRNRYNREFISTVTHELKMPVTAIKGAAELLEQGAMDKPAPRAKFLRNIRFESDRLTRMVWELNELTKLDVEMLTGQKERVNYVQCMRDIVDRLMPTFDQDHAKLILTAPEQQVDVMLVPGRIQQVISNLLENAFRYTPVSGRVEITIAEQDGSTVLTTVADTGPGIPPAHLSKIFDRFYTTEQKGTPKDYGSGLGLAIARTIIENHQGRIWVDSVPGQGATFSFTLPAAS